MNLNSKIINFETSIHCLHPRCFDDATEIAQYLVNYQAVEVHFNLLDNVDAHRILDFLSGVIYALDGDIILISDKCVYFSTDKIQTAMIKQQQCDSQLIPVSSYINNSFLC